MTALRYVYRGVHVGHPVLHLALQGIVQPGDVDGDIDADRHNETSASAGSPFTSWTFDIRYARYYMNGHGPGGVMLRLPYCPPAPNESWRWEFSMDRFGESEVLLRGVRTDAEVFER